PGVAALTEGMVRIMMMRKALTAVAIILTVCLVGLGVGVSIRSTPAAEPEQVEERVGDRPKDVREPERQGDAARQELLLPPASALCLALVSLDERGRLVVRGRITRPAGTEGLQTMRYEAARARVYEAGGKLVNLDAFPRLRKQEVLAFVVCGGPAAGPAYLRLLKEGTLAFVLPEPESEAPAPPPRLV